MLRLEVGKKYLDVAGREWEVTGIMKTPKETLYGVKGGGLTTWCPAASLISEVHTTPTFKVGDRVKVKAAKTAEASGDVVGTNHAVVTVRTYGFGELNFWPHELEHLTDTSPTHVPTCTCDIHAIMRSGCSCGHARVAIEQEFKREGWR